MKNRINTVLWVACNVKQMTIEMMLERLYIMKLMTVADFTPYLKHNF